MLYSIIPPALIILSLAGIIAFFIKKAPQIARLNEDGHSNQAEEIMMSEVGFWQNIVNKIKSIKWDDAKHLLLAVLEKITHRVRLIFLKSESRLKNFNDSIRSKRNNHKLKIEAALNSDMDNIEEDDIINKVKNYQVEDRNKKVIQKTVRPTLSDRVVTPKSQIKAKDKLENLLIERIAANPKDMEAYERLGEYYMEIESLNDAKECFKQVLKLDPKNKNVKYRMKRLEIIMQRR